MLQQLKQNWQKYILDILVIIIGISISFLLDEWRQNLQEKDIEIESLESIRSNLMVDTVILNTRIKRCEVFLWSYSQILKYDSLDFPKDSLKIYLDHTLTYSTFEATQIGYEALKQTGNAKLISNKELLTSIIQLYEQDLELIEEWSDIDKFFVVNEMIPYTMKTIQFTPRTAYLYDNNEDILKLLKSNDTFKNQIKMDELNKLAAKYSYLGILNKMTHILAEIDKELDILQ